MTNSTPSSYTGHSSIQVIPSGSNLKPVQMAGANNCLIQELFTPANNAPNFSMRLFEVKPGGHTPQHTHAWEHEIFILQGQGEIRSSDANIPFKASDALLVPAGTLHQFYNSGQETLRFICLVPNTANY
jgi:quercetin dioxygenase-like cupin family protein